MCLRVSCGSIPSRPREPPAASIEVMSTTSACWLVTERTSEGTDNQSISMRSGSIGAITVTMRESNSGPLAPWIRPRTRRSKTTTSTRSPARVASAARSSDDSKAVSMRGSLAIRAAEVRPLSITITTRRSRSGRQVRTTRSLRRAVARQSMERTSSPRTYSRRLSNSVPCPRIITLVRPSSSRSLASRDGRCLRELNGGSTVMAPGRSMVACRARSPSGPNDRTVTCAARRSPRRNGVREVSIRRRSPAGSSSRARVGDAPAEGCQPSRTMPRIVRRPRLVSSSADATVSPSRTRSGSSRSSRSCRGEPASSRSSTATRIANRSQMPSKSGWSSRMIGTIPSATSSTNRPDHAIRSRRSSKSAPAPG